VVYWLELNYGVGSRMTGVGLMVGGDMRLRDGNVYCELVRIMDFFFLVLFFYNHIVSVKEMDVIMI
jgi:hypothetical protein